MSWDREFDEPIPLPDGKTLITLRQAGEYIIALPHSEHEPPAWQAAMEALILVVEHRGPTMFARIAMMRALYPKGAPVFDPWRNEKSWTGGS